jgi:hypothetical protein
MDGDRKRSLFKKILTFACRRQLVQMPYLRGKMKTDASSIKGGWPFEVRRRHENRGWGQKIIRGKASSLAGKIFKKNVASIEKPCMYL